MRVGQERRVGVAGQARALAPRARAGVYVVVIGGAQAMQRGSREETSRREGCACEPGRTGASGEEVVTGRHRMTWRVVTTDAGTRERRVA